MSTVPRRRVDLSFWVLGAQQGESKGHVSPIGNNTVFSCENMYVDEQREHYLSTYIFPRSGIGAGQRAPSSHADGIRIVHRPNAPLTTAHLRCSRKRRHAPVRAASEPRRRCPAHPHAATAQVPQSSARVPQPAASRRLAASSLSSIRRLAQAKLSIHRTVRPAAPPPHLRVKPERPCAIHV